jgi:hypothetical protein
MFVVAMSDNLRVRRIFEDKMVQQLTLKGVDAIASYSVFPNKLPDKSKVNEYLKEAKLQTIFVAQIIDKEDKTVRYPGNFGSGLSFNNYYDSTYGYIYDDGYSVSYEYVNIEFTVFDTKSELPIWSASSESVDPTDINKVTDELVKIVMSDMSQNLLKNTIPLTSSKSL